MGYCMKCGAEVRDPKKFCGTCGTSVVESGNSNATPPATGLSTIRLDRDGVNLILKEVSNPQLQVTFEDGRVQVQQGAIKGTLGLQLSSPTLEACFSWSGPSGSVSLRVEQIQTDAQGLEIRLRLTR